MAKSKLIKKLGTGFESWKDENTRQKGKKGINNPKKD